ncbi:MAG: hypothetical protein FJY83_10830, partial [Candidatus Aminicenantes bacterium]|nr:hypothetical protein [Candidatus Aminicenantes bacterium]
MKRIALFFLPLFLLAAYGPARGQYTNSYGYSFNNPVSAACNQIIWDRMNARLVYRSMLKKRGYTDAQLGQMSTDQMRSLLGGQSAAQAEAQKSSATAATKFKPSGKRLLLPAMAGSMAAAPEHQQALLEIFEEGVEAYEAEAKRSGFSNDVAGAMMFFIGASYFVYHDAREPDENGLEAIGRALQQNMDTEDVRQISNADKQQFYELMVGLGTYLGVAYQQAV